MSDTLTISLTAGTCYGPYIVLHVHADESGQDIMRGGVSLHPSHPMIMTRNGEDEEEVYQSISTPQYFMNTPDMGDSVRSGGLADNIIETV